MATEEKVCVECGITFDPPPWANPDDPICDLCIEEDVRQYVDEQEWWFDDEG